MAAALLLVLVLTAAEAKPKAKELAPDPLPSAQVEVLINGSRPEDVLSPKSDFGPIVQNASKLGEFGYAKHPKHVLIHNAEISCAGRVCVHIAQKTLNAHRFTSVHSA